MDYISKEFFAGSTFKIIPASLKERHVQYYQHNSHMRCEIDEAGARSKHKLPERQALAFIGLPEIDKLPQHKACNKGYNAAKRIPCVSPAVIGQRVGNKAWAQSYEIQYIPAVRRCVAQP